MIVLFLALAASPVPSPASGERSLPLDRAARPLALPDGSYRVDFSGRYGLVDEDEGLFRLDFGARMGLPWGLEVGLDLVRWNFSRLPGWGLEQPRLQLIHRWLGGPVEVGARFGAEVPSGGDVAGDVAILGRAHAGRWGRMDLELGIAGSSSGIRPDSQAFGRAGLVIGRGPVSLAAAGELRLLTLVGAETLAGRLAGELGFAWPRDDGGVAWEVLGRVATPLARWEGRALEGPRFGFGWEGGAALRLFFDRPAPSAADWTRDDVLR